MGNKSAVETENTKRRDINRKTVGEKVKANW